MLGTLAPLFDLHERIDGKGVSKTMRGGLTEVHMTNDSSWLIKPDLFDCLMKKKADPVGSYGIVVFA